jgi:hypothetical protein
MPLTIKGKKLLKKFQEEYGKENGTKIFYSYEHKHPENLIDKQIQKNKKRYI